MAEFDDESVERLARTNRRVEKWAYENEQMPATTAYSYGATCLVKITGGLDGKLRAYPGLIVERLQSTTSTTTAVSTSSTVALVLPAGKVECATFPKYGDGLPVWVYVEGDDAGKVALNSSIVMARVIGVEPDGKIVLFHSAKCAEKGPPINSPTGCVGFTIWAWNGTARTWSLESTTCITPCKPVPPQFCPPVSDHCIKFRSACQTENVSEVSCNGTTSTVCLEAVNPCLSCAGYNYVAGFGYVLVHCNCPERCPCWPGGEGLEPPSYVGIPSLEAAMLLPCGYPHGTGHDGCIGAAACGNGDQIKPQDCKGVCGYYAFKGEWILYKNRCSQVTISRTGVILTTNICACPYPAEKPLSDGETVIVGTDIGPCEVAETHCGLPSPCPPMKKTTTSVAPTSCEGVCFYRWDTTTGGYVYAGTTCVGCSCTTPLPRGNETECSYLTVKCGKVPTTTTTTTTTTSTKPIEFFCVSPPDSTYKFCMQGPVPATYTVNSGPHSTVAACNSNCAGPSTSTSTVQPCPTSEGVLPPAGGGFVKWTPSSGVWVMVSNDCGANPQPPTGDPQAWFDTYGVGCLYYASCYYPLTYYCKYSSADGSYSCTTDTTGGGVLSGPYSGDSTCGGGCGPSQVGCWQHSASGVQSCFAANPGTGYSLVTGPFADMAACEASGCGGFSPSSTSTLPP